MDEGLEDYESANPIDGAVEDVFSPPKMDSPRTVWFRENREMLSKKEEEEKVAKEAIMAKAREYISNFSAVNLLPCFCDAFSPGTQRTHRKNEASESRGGGKNFRIERASRGKRLATNRSHDRFQSRRPTKRRFPSKGTSLSGQGC